MKTNTSTKTATRTKRAPLNGVAPQYRTVNGKRMVLLEVREYERLREKADEWEPLLPEPLPNGNYPAKEYMLASLARKIIRHRRPAVATVEKIDRALKAAEAEDRG